MLTEAAEKHQPDIIFYIGAVEGGGVPKPSTLRDLRRIAPVVNFCSDAADIAWEKAIGGYRKHQSFDVHVAIDGGRTADLATLTPVDEGYYFPRKRNIRLGFSGTVTGFNPRSEVVRALDWFGDITIRNRGGNYYDHVDFMCRTQMLVNTAWTGSGQRFHIKGRVLEAGFAGCALFEHIDSPIGEWFPEGAWFPWKTPKDILEIANDITDEEISESANLLQKTVQEKYTAKQIYQEILDFVGITK